MKKILLGIAFVFVAAHMALAANTAKDIGTYKLVDRAVAVTDVATGYTAAVGSNGHLAVDQWAVNPMTVISVTNSASNATIAVASQATVNCTAINITNYKTFAVAYKANGDVANVTLKFEQSWQTPGAEGAGDFNYTIPVGASDIVTALTTNSTWYVKSITPIALPYLRIIAYGNTTNNANTTMNIKLIGQQ